MIQTKKVAKAAFLYVLKLLKQQFEYHSDRIHGAQMPTTKEMTVTAIISLMYRFSMTGPLTLP